MEIAELVASIASNCQQLAAVTAGKSAGSGCCPAIEQVLVPEERSILLARGLSHFKFAVDRQAAAPGELHAGDNIPEHDAAVVGCAHQHARVGGVALQDVGVRRVARQRVLRAAVPRLPHPQAVVRDRRDHLWQG